MKVLHELVTVTGERTGSHTTEPLSSGRKPIRDDPEVRRPAGYKACFKATSIGHADLLQTDAPVLWQELFF